MKYFFSCGELSGDRIAAHIAKELFHDPTTQIRALGGPHLQKAGVENVLSIDSLQVMGWTDVFLNLSRIINLLQKTKDELLEFRPAIVILIDNPSFNLRLAKWCKSQQIKVIYLIPPKVWASRPGRIRQLKLYCDKVLSLFPFEQIYLSSKGVNASYYGHPLAEELRQLKFNPNFKTKLKLDTRPILSILPGSRVQEIKHTLPALLDAVQSFTSTYNIVISIAPSIKNEQIQSIIPDQLIGDIHLTSESSLEILQHSFISLITSGTATLEAALLSTPHICCYKMNTINYQIGKRILVSKFISLPNIILDQKLTPELIQKDCSRDRIISEIKKLEDPTQRSLQTAGFHKIVNTLYYKNSISSLAQAISSER